MGTRGHEGLPKVSMFRAQLATAIKFKRCFVAFAALSLSLSLSFFSPSLCVCFVYVLSAFKYLCAHLWHRSLRAPSIHKNYDFMALINLNVVG